jgi:hypothetical protein
MEYGVGNDHIDGTVRLPLPQVGGDKVEPAVDRQWSRRGDHVERAVDAGDPRLGPQLDQAAGEVARTAAEIDDPVRGFGADPSE